LPFTAEKQVLFGCFGYRNSTMKHISASELSPCPESSGRVVVSAFRMDRVAGGQRQQRVHRDPVLLVERVIAVVVREPAA
jgi:hypothetical protein